jgi:hypothetical protein
MTSPKLTPKQEALYQLMSDISEDCYCAGWMHGNEFTLWEIVSDPSVDHEYGRGSVDDDDIAKLRELSAEIGGWIRWRNDDDDPLLPVEDWGPVFVPMDEWLRRYRDDQDKRSRLTRDCP